MLALIMFTKSGGMVVAGARCQSGVECGSVVVRLVRVRVRDSYSKILLSGCVEDLWSNYQQSAA